MPSLALKRIADPITEPVPLADMKAWLRLDAGFVQDDGLISGLITAARERAEDFLGRALVSQQWQLNLDYFPCYSAGSSAPPGRAGNWASGYWWDTQAVNLPRPPLVTVDSITYIAGDGTVQTLPTTAYVADNASEPGRVLPTYNAYWPSALSVPNSITIKYTSGYATVPQTFVLAIKLMVTAWYENASDFSIGGGAATELPLGSQRLMQAHRVGYDYR